MKRFYVTTPIYYVNDVPHTGHAYTTIAADILARFNRLSGNEVFFLTGTDEHGQKVQKAAAAKGLTPQEHADRLMENFKELWERLSISNDAFIRTTDVEHRRVVQEILCKLYERGEIVKRPYKGWYCIPDERFWTEKEIIDRNCPECGRPVEEIEEENYFFLMSMYQDRLIRYIEKNPGFILPETRKNEVLGFLKSRKLGDLCISRPRRRLSWGVPLPFDEDYVTYVWFDALLNYYSATRYLAPEHRRQRTEHRQKNIKDNSLSSVFCSLSSEGWWPADCHIVGKDILTTHAVYWSTMLMALEMPLPRNIFAHGWWTIEGMKMSKSLGNVVDPNSIISTYGVDTFRYFLFREVPFGLDGDFSTIALVRRINSDLANDLGNLISRTITMARMYFDNRVPEPDGIDEKLKDLSEGLFEKVRRALSTLAFQRVIEEIWSLVDYLNKYIDSNQPWALARDSEKRGYLSRVIYSAMEGIRFVTLYLYPFMPGTCGKIYKQLGIDKPIRETLYTELKWGGLMPGTPLERPEPLFPRIQLSKESEKEIQKIEKIQKQRPEPDKRSPKEEKSAPDSATSLLISIDEFAKVELRVGKIVEAERIQGSKKLIKLKVDIGEIRQIVAGIGKVYTPEIIVGKKVVVLANLNSMKLMGVESQGMLLASGDDDNLSIISPEKDIKEGTRVK